MTEFLTVEDASELATAVLHQPVRDYGLLASAVARPQASAFGADAYASFPAKVAALIDGINRSHPLVDGNKRLSWLCAVVFAQLNGFDLTTHVDEGERVILAVAAGTMELDALTDWVSAHLSELSD